MSQANNMRVLVTGGAGFIGSALIRHLIATSDHTVLNFDKLGHASSLASLAAVADDPRYSFVQADICDSAAVRQALQDFKPDVIVHLAAETHVDRSIDGPQAFVETNLVGSAVLLQDTLEYWRQLSDNKRAAFRFVHVSTDEVFGTLGATGAFDEHSPYDPRSPYAASKAGSDHLARSWWHTFGLPVVITNCCNNYGPYQFPEKLIPLVILRALAAQPIPIYGDGRQVRDWIAVSDHVCGLQMAFERAEPGTSYAIGSHAERSNMELVQAICAHLDQIKPRTDGASYAQQITHVADRPGHDRRYAIDASLIGKELGWAPQIDLDTGLAETVRWYVENRYWWEAILAKEEATARQGLGLSERGGS